MENVEKNAFSFNEFLSKIGLFSRELSTAHSENTEIDCLSFFIEFSAWFHIVFDRYTPEYAHFTYFNPIWPLSKYEFRRNRSWPHPDTVSYVVGWVQEFLEFHIDADADPWMLLSLTLYP